MKPSAERDSAEIERRLSSICKRLGACKEVMHEEDITKRDYMKLMEALVVIRYDATLASSLAEGLR